MIQLKDTKYQKTSDFLSNAVDIAEYYGFTSIDEIPRAQSADRRPRTATHANDPEILFARRDERALPPIVRRVLTLARPSHGTLLAWRVADATNNNPATSLELHVMGTNSSIAEALLIVVANAIMEEAGVGQRTLSINNLGGPESSGRYVRDVGTYLRKHLDSITPTLRPRAATDPLGTLIQLIERGHPAVSRAPQSMEYLTEEERHRFWELLEYLETSGLPYELNSQILGSRDFWSHTLFEMSAVDTESGVRMPFALGGRYDPLASRLKRAPEHSAMIAIAVESRGKSTVKSEEHGIPLIYFAHLGSEARRRAIPLLENLRSAAIPVHQGLWYEKIGDQMNAAKDLAVPYILILGHKETMDGTVLVREVATNSQNAIPLDEVAGYLKRRRAVLNPPIQVAKG